MIRGETSHYETVCAESARGMMDLALAENLAIGNGILTVENEAQAWERADAVQRSFVEAHHREASSIRPTVRHAQCAARQCLQLRALC